MAALVPGTWDEHRHYQSDGSDAEQDGLAAAAEIEVVSDDDSDSDSDCEGECYG